MLRSRLSLFGCVAVLMTVLAVRSVFGSTIMAQGNPTPTPNINWVSEPQGINVRGGPGFNYDLIGRLPVGAWVQPLARNTNGDWILISYLTTTGWVEIRGVSWRLNVAALPVIERVDPTPISPPLNYNTPGGPTQTPNANWVNVGADGAFVRAGPGQGYIAVGVVYTGDVVDPVAHDEALDWVLIRFGDGYGWVRYDLVVWFEPIDGLPVVDVPALTPNFTEVPLIPTNTATLTPTKTPIPTLTSTSTFTPFPTITPTYTSTLTLTSTLTPSPTFTYTPSSTPSPTLTSTLIPSATLTETPSPTATLTETVTPSPTSTATYTASPESTVTSTPTETPTFAPTDPPTASSTPTEEPAMAAVLPTATASLTPTMSETPTLTYTATYTPSAEPTQTATEAIIPTVTPTRTIIPTLMTEMPTYTLTPLTVAGGNAGENGDVNASPDLVTPAITESETEESGVVSFTAAILAGSLLVLAMSYVAVYAINAANLDRYREGFVLNVCPVCVEGNLYLEERGYRLLGIPRVRRVVRCDVCRSVLRQVGSRRWRYAVDNMENSDLYDEFNNQVLTEDELIDILGAPPQYIEDDDLP